MVFRAATLCSYVFGACVVVLGSSFAQAQGRSGDAEAAVLEITKSIDRMRCGNSMCAAATAMELKSPILANPMADLVFKRGLVSGLAKICGADWRRRNFLPMMSSLRDQGLSERQRAVAGALHGYGMGLAEQSALTCDDQQRAQLHRALDFKR